MIKINPAGLASCKKITKRVRPYSYTLLILLSYFQLIGQEKTAQEKESLITINDLFNDIHEKMGYRFFYSEEIVDLENLIALDIEGKEVQTIIQELKQKTNLDFKILENKLIIVVSSEKEQQKNVVTGKVYSSTDKLGIAGVNVFVKGTTTGTITDANGEYALEVDDRYIIMVFSFIGFETREIALNGQSQLDIELNENMEGLAEVMVTALNISRDKNSLGYSVTQLDGDDINRTKENNVISSMTGKVAGLQITKAPTGVDGSTRVVLRGINSLTGNNRPLVVVDGIPINAGYGGAGQWGGKDMGDALSDLNAEDIESYSILKGAGAAAAYGSRGANGVILITTKKGAKSDRIGISVSSSYQVETPMVYPDFQNEYGHGAFGQYPTKMNPNDISDTPIPWSWSWGPRMDGKDRLDFVGNVNLQLNSDKLV